jgi:hypothetical protein
MLIHFNLNISPYNLDVIRDENKQYSMFFYNGHPLFLIPDFSKSKCDIWKSFLDFLEETNNNDIYDENGGEVHSYEIIDKETGLTRCKYTAYDIMLDEDSDHQDYELEIEGYVINDTEPYFLTTSVLVS